MALCFVSNSAKRQAKQISGDITEKRQQGDTSIDKIYQPATENSAPFKFSMLNLGGNAHMIVARDGSCLLVSAVYPIVLETRPVLSESHGT